MSYRILFLLFTTSCLQATPQKPASGLPETCSLPTSKLLVTSGKTAEKRFIPPHGYTRLPLAPNSFASYLRSLPLKPHGSPVLLYNGAEKPNQRAHAAVIHMDVGPKNLQQCADAIMRLRAEYLYQRGFHDKIHFNFTSGFRASWSRWAVGDRIRVSGNSVSWQPNGKPGFTYSSFREYLDIVFSYAGTLSLSKELKSLAYSELQPGDVLIQGGSPGHAVIVVDIAMNPAGKKVYLLAQSYMPAQEIHILNNPSSEELSPWYELDESKELIQTPEWDFYTYNLKRFPEE